MKILGLYSLNEKYSKPNQKDNDEKLIINSIKTRNTSKTIKNISNKFETLSRDASIQVTSNSINTTNLISSASSGSNSLAVTIVPQGNYNICWAATVASIANYRNKSSLTAINVADAMKTGYVAVDPSVSANALNHYGVPSTFISSVPDFSTIMDNIDNGKPIYMSSTSQIGGHATTLTGYTTSSQGVVITLIDPAYECFKQSYSGGTNYTYDFGGTTMTWTRTVMINRTPYPGYYIQYGSTGSNVVSVQIRLNALGFNCGTADGVFGNMTKNAVIAFQNSRGLAADGVIGPTTWQYLFNM